MPSVDINWVAVLLAVVVNMAVGAFWYSPQLFGKKWAKLVGRKVGQMGGNNGYAIGALGALVQAFVLVHFVRYTGALSFTKGAEAGFWLWLGFVAVVMAGAIVYEGRHWRLWQINAGYYLVVLVVNGGLLAAWR